MTDDKTFLLECVDKIYHQNLIGVDAANILREIVHKDEIPLLPSLRSTLFVNTNPELRYGASYLLLNYYLEHRMFSLMRELLGNCTDRKVNEFLSLFEGLPKITDAALEDPNGARLLVTHAILRKAYKKLIPLLMHKDPAFRKEVCTGLEEELLANASCVPCVKGAIDNAVRDGKLTKETVPDSLRSALAGSGTHDPKSRSAWGLADLFLSSSRTDQGIGRSKKKILN